MLFIYAGLGLTICFCPKKFQNFTFFFSPFVGLAYLSIFSWWGIHFIPGGIDAIILPLLIVPTLSLIAAAWTKKREIASLMRPPNKDTIWLIIIYCIIFIFISFPVIFLLNSANVVVIGNNDIINYAAVSKILVSSSLVNPTPNVDAHLLYLIETNNFGAFIATAFPSALFSVQTYIVQNSIVNIFFIFTLPILYTIAVTIFRYRPTMAMGVSILIGLNIHLIYIIYTGFVGQVIGFGMFIALLLATLYPILNCKQSKDFWEYIPLASILLFGMIATYSPFIPIFFLPLFGYLILIALINKDFKAIIPILKFLIISTIIGMIFAIPLVINRFQEILYFSTSIPAGWPMPTLGPEQIMGIVGNDVGWFPIQNSAINSIPLPIMLRISLSCIIIALFILSLRKLYQTDRNVFYFGIFFLGMIFIGYSYYSVVEMMSPAYTGDSYKAYKLLTYGLPIIIIFLFVYFRDIDLFKPENVKKKWQSVLILILLITGCLWSSMAMMDMISQKSYPIKPNIIDLQKIDNIQNVTSINVEESNYKDQMWIYYFLFMNKTVHLKYRTYFAKSPLIGEWTLKSNYNNIINIDNGDEKIPLNDDYYLIKNESTLTADFDKGWFMEEFNGNGAFRWTGYNNETPTLAIHSSNFSTVNLNLSYVPLIQNNTFSVFLDNGFIKDCQDSRFCEIKQIRITRGDHIIEFIPQISPISPGAKDPRTLGYAFIYINLTATSSTSGVSA